MGCLLGIVRSLISLVLGLAIFIAFLGFLLSSNFSDKLLSADFYIDTLAGEDTYNRIYDEVLVDDQLRATTEDLLGDIEVVDLVDIVALLRRILPPEYVQSQVEGTIQSAIDYLNKDTDTLDLYIELAPPLVNAQAVLFDYIDGRIDALDLEEPGVPDCTGDRINDLASRYEVKWRELARGEVPTSIPSLASLNQACRTAIFNLAYPSLLQDDSLNERTRQGLRESRPDIEREFIAGNTREVLKLAARPLAAPLIDEAIDQLRERLDDQDRFDIIGQIAEWDTDLTKEEMGVKIVLTEEEARAAIDLKEKELREDIETTRKWVYRSKDFGKAVTLALVIVAAFVMGMVQFPSLTNGLRWPGIFLMLTGGFYFGVGKFLESTVPDRLADLVERGAEEVTEVPPSVTILGGDLLISFGKSITEGFADPSLTLIIVGAVVFATSFLVMLIRPFVPFIK